MSKRNVVWLAVIAVAVVLGWLVGGPWIGVLAGVVALVVSETVERTRRRRRRATSGVGGPTVRDVLAAKRRNPDGVDPER